MKRSIKIAVAAAMALSATSAFATNGDHLIGLGAKARGMGGIGIGMSHGAESALANPAMISSVKGTEVSFGGTVFMPDVQTDMGMGAGSKASTADMSVIPEVSIASKVSDNLYIGVGMWGTAGMGVDYRNEASNFKMVTNLQLMQFGVPIAYESNGLSVGISPVVQYGALDINYDTTGTPFPSAGVKGAGVAQDLAFGYNIGAAYSTQGFTIGAAYKSAIEMDYYNVLSTAMAGFGVTGFSNKLEQPAEMGIGASYKMGEHSIAVDYKKIKWSDAKGYKEFGWDDQNVYAIGYAYDAGNWTARLGYNYGKSPIKNQGISDGGLDNVLNFLGFPATVESHYTVGCSYDLSKTASFDLAYVYAPEVTDTLPYNFGGGMAGNLTTKHSQDSLSMQVNFNF
ncbi:MAG: outer membrane protein transport protein [Sulfuricurvum sp.]|nr:outer membrane protein transport protein [Sulfuricurvum sp.]